MFCIFCIFLFSNAGCRNIQQKIVADSCSECRCHRIMNDDLGGMAHRSGYCKIDFRGQAPERLTLNKVLYDSPENGQKQRELFGIV